MGLVSSPGQMDVDSLRRPLVLALFVSSCLLSIVSWYTTQQGMALYLATWFSILASLGVQVALVMVAWLIGLTKTRRALLVAVYSITAVISIAFSYVSLYTWFSARERPAEVQRQLYDGLTGVAGKSQELVTAAIAEGQKHVLALDEMTTAERSHGYISRAEDADPYLGGVREAVAREARTYSGAYREGSGEGLRYTAFDRYAKLARQSVSQLQQAKSALDAFRTQHKPLDATEQQLRSFRQVYDAIPWGEVEQQLHAGKLQRPSPPAYTEFVDRSVSGQEDLTLAFQGLAAPTQRHALALALAAFIDVIVFLLAYASGPHLFGSAERRWVAAGAAMDAADGQVFVRDLLRKTNPGSQGTARVEVATLSPGERQLCMLLAAKGLAVHVEEEGELYYLLDAGIHESLVESLATPGLPLRSAMGQPRGVPSTG